MSITSVISGMSSSLLSSNSFPASSPVLPVPSRLGPSCKTDNLEALEEAITQLKQGLERVGIDIDIHDDSGRIVTRVIDRESGDVIRQIPTEEVLHMARMAAYQQGQLLKTTA
ncbi:flagellar protein FlaG [Kushneria marisflavi]|uniref:Uncharacterized protein n=1 Tax=Kushneria marisflavi TaxID=157779 RepID=A0A240USJ4_9GAMM|nr:flagellar protein FlaG [Kushneria marisflavi]ART64448.1 hypothetical protein B9H00_16420 [Kushneria marisflavi]RKD86603.1 FlaG protein [Kushneria marisflavi]